MNKPLDNEQTEREASDWLFRLQDRHLSEKEAAKFKEWQQHPDNAREFARIESIWEGMEVLPLRSMLDDVLSSRTSKPNRLHAWFVVLHQFVSSIWLKRGAVLAGTTALAWMAGLYLPLDTVDIRTGVQETKTVTLPDGSRIAANARTHLSVRYTLLRRTVTMDDGEAFFDIAHNRYRPFGIDAGSTHVRVLGTSFNVTALPDQLEVAVNHGRVRILDDRIAGENILIRGDIARISRTTEVDIQLANREPEEAGSWRNGILVVHDEPLANVIQKMRRYLPFSITFDDEAAEKHTLSGTIDTSRPVEFLKNLPMLAPVKVSTQQDGSTLIGSKKS